jgi:hypothetical protein
MLPPWASNSQARPKADRVICSTWYEALESQAYSSHTPAPLLPFISRSEFLRIRVPATSCAHRALANEHLVHTSVLRQPPMGFCGSTTLTDRGSDLHRVCLARLCCAFRFSQPLDAFIPPLPFRPCFMPVTPLSFCLQRIPPPDSRNASRRRLPLLPLHVVRRQHLEIFSPQ